ncbi:MAG: Uncharacterised protein [Prochlorococcus marinus str. MIT 9313]|nr:MAG: Uncharacterised protein [Prochlorococcus marinus str. MIT 9313]
MVNQEGHQQLGAAEVASFIYGCNAVAIAIEHQTHGGLSGSAGGLHSCDQLAQIWGEGFGRVAAEQRVALVANFLNQALVVRVQ